MALTGHCALGVFLNAALSLHEFCREIFIYIQLYRLCLRMGNGREYGSLIRDHSSAFFEQSFYC